MTEKVTAAILFVIAMAAFIMSYFSFKEKGFLLNNAYIHASRRKRENMDKKPYYRQSAIVFFLIGNHFSIECNGSGIEKGMDFFNCIGFIDIDPGLCHPIQYNNQQKGIAQEKHRSTLPVYWVEAMIRGKGYASSSKQLAQWLTEMGFLAVCKDFAH